VSLQLEMSFLKLTLTRLDLTAASRAYLMEPQWNPQTEEQALCRVYRLGQKRNVTTIRYRMLNSFEEVLFLLMLVLGLLLTSFIERCQDPGPEERLSEFNVFKCKTIRDRRWGRSTSVSACGVEMRKDLFIQYPYSIYLATAVALPQ